MRQGSAGTVGATARPGIGRLPKEGSILRYWYDAFTASPGVPIRFGGHKRNSGPNLLNQLEDMYGLVVKKVDGKPSCRVLVARYIGAEYVKYEVKHNGEATD